MKTLLIIGVLLFGYTLVSVPLNRRSISGPLVFIVAGIVFGPAALDAIDPDIADGAAVELLAESTLVLVLFSDATRIRLRELRSGATIPGRLLTIGLPLTFGLGALGALLLFPELLTVEAMLLAAILTPTDAALGQAVVSDERVPVRIRQALNVESGLNDGLMVPVITVLIAIAASELGQTSTNWAVFIAKQLGFGVGVGVFLGYTGAVLLGRFVSRGYVEGVMRQIGTLAVPAMMYLAAELLGGNGFVAAFVGGIIFGHLATEACRDAVEFTEDQGQLLALITFMFFGAVLMGPRLDDLTPTIALYVVASLTLIRMVPVAISLIGTGFEAPTVGYLGWFGPRGLASILFVLSATEEIELAGGDFAGGEIVLTVVAWTVFSSAVLHGLSAVPLAGRYAAWSAHMTGTPELEPSTEIRPRSVM